MNTPRDNLSRISPSQVTMESRMYQNNMSYQQTHHHQQQQPQQQQSNMHGRQGLRMLKPIVQTKIVEIPKEVYMEKIIEVPQIKFVERVVEDIRPVYKYKNIYQKKQVFVEKVKHVEKVVYEEKIIEVPQNKYVEKYVDVPVYVNREKIVQVPRYMIVEKVIPILRNTKKEIVVEIPEVELPEINVNENVHLKDSVAIQDLKENETTEVTLESDLKMLNELAKTKEEETSNANISGIDTMHVEAQHETYVQDETTKDYLQMDPNMYTQTSQLNQYNQTAQTNQYNQTAQTNQYNQTAQTNQYNQTAQANQYNQTAQTNQYDHMINENYQSVQKSNYPVYTNMNSGMNQFTSQFNHVSKTYQPKGGYVPKIKIAKTSPKNNKGCYCGCN